MEKRYQVFVSSTFADLKEQRQAIVQAILSFDHFPAGMELFPATNDDQWTLIKSVIDDSDYYIIVVGGRYGSTTAEGISYTEMEFDYAVQTKKPILAFVHSKPEEIPAGKTDQNDELRKRLDEFKKKVMTGRHVRPWSTTMELQAAVMQSLVAETKRNPQEGWIRASRAADPEALRQLLEEKAALIAQVAAMSTSAPVGTEDLEGGEDDYELPVIYEETALSQKATHNALLDWNTIFREVGPVLMNEGTEAAMRTRLAEEALLYPDKDEANPGPSYSSRISNEHFETIKIQLMALGLIRRGTAKRAPSDRNAYWALTPFGEAQLVQLRARRRSAQPATEGDAG